MDQKETTKKNLDLHAEWMRYCFEHPEMLDRLPQGAQVVIIPDNDPHLAEANRKIADDLKNKGLPVVIVHLDLPKPPVPRLEIITAHS